MPEGIDGQGQQDGWPDDERQQAEWHAWTDHDSVRTAHKGIPGPSVPALRRKWRRIGLRVKEDVQNGRARGGQADVRGAGLETRPL